MKMALTANILAARRLLPVAALRAFLGRVGFIDSLDRDLGEPGFVLNHPSKLAIGPLVQPLVHGATVVDPITDAANITDGAWLVRSVASICLNEEVNVIGANRQGIDLPAVLFGYIVEHFFQSVRHCILENRSPSFRAPHEMNHTK